VYVALLSRMRTRLFQIDDGRLSCLLFLIFLHLGCLFGEFLRLLASVPLPPVAAARISGIDALHVDVIPELVLVSSRDITLVECGLPGGSGRCGLMPCAARRGDGRRRRCADDSAGSQREGGARGGLTPPPHVRGAGAGEGTGRRDRGLGNDEEDLPVAGGLSREIPGMRPAELGRWLGRIGGKNGGSSHLSWGLRRRLFPEIPGGDGSMGRLCPG